MPRNLLEDYDPSPDEAVGVSGQEDVTDDTEANILQLTWDYQLGEHTLRSITAYTDYDYNKCSDVDYASINFLDQCTDETHEQFTQEFLLTSPIGETFEYLAGVYYQDAKLEFANNIGAQWSGVPRRRSSTMGSAALSRDEFRSRPRVSTERA